VYLLALLSIKRVAAFLDAGVGGILRTIGIEYIALVFIADFYQGPLQGGAMNVIIYLPFLIMAVAGPLLRLAAVVKRRSAIQRLAV
jgi:hypothetical protein